MTSTATDKPYAIDTQRVLRGDPDAPDAVWVPVTGKTHDDVESMEARRDAIRYAVEQLGGGDAIDKTYGPYPDDGQVRPQFNNEADERNSFMSADQYLQMAASQAMSGTKVKRMIAYYRVRRNALM